MMRFAARSFALVLVALAAVSPAGASSSTTNGKLVYAMGRTDFSHPPRILVSNANGSKPAPLTTSASPYGDTQPHVSANGKKVVFLRATGSGFQIWIATIVTGHAHQVRIAGLPTKSLFAPTFTPNGKTIIFELDSLGGNALGIWKVASSGGKAKRVLKGNYAQPTVSPDGTKLAFVHAGKLEIAAITGQGAKTVYNAAAAGASASKPDFSPDGRHLAFVLFKGRASNIAIVTSTGGVPKKLTNDPSTEGTFSPAFSPDGKTIAFTHTVHNGDTTTSEIDSVPAAGGSTSVLVPASTSSSFLGVDWQPKR